MGKISRLRLQRQRDNNESDAGIMPDELAFLCGASLVAGPETGEAADQGFPSRSRCHCKHPSPVKTSKKK